MNATPSLFARASAEIIEFHRFFVAWYDTATADATDFGRCEQVFGSDFHMIPPTGCVLDRSTTIGMLRSSRASYSGDFSIEIDDLRIGWEAEEAIVVTYIEAQSRAGKASRRQASALFTTSSSAPNGVQWQHLHETWVQMPES